MLLYFLCCVLAIIISNFKCCAWLTYNAGLLTSSRSSNPTLATYMLILWYCEDFLAP